MADEVAAPVLLKDQEDVERARQGLRPLLERVALS